MAVVAHAFEDYEEALKWAQKAASESDEAAFLLGQMYANGRGVSQNKNQAVYWFKEAARKGHKEAKTVLDQYREGALGGKT
jgi:TPR repeat protein